MNARSRCLVIPLLAVIQLPILHAEVIQADGADHLAFEAENFSETQTDTFINTNRSPSRTHTVMWQKRPQEQASGGYSMQAVVGCKVPQEASTHASLTYEMTFKTPGTYSLYFRIKAATKFSKSVYYSAGFNPDPQQATYCYLGTPNRTEQFQWLQNNPHISQFKITEEDQAVRFHLKVREQEFEVDRIIFSLNNALQAADLDQLSNSPTGD